MTTISPSGRTSFDSHRLLVAWIVQNGGYWHEGVQLAFTEDSGYHAVVASQGTIKAQTQIARCPTSATLSVLNALDVDSFSCHESRFPQPFLRQYCFATDVLQTFFLMEQRVLGDQSWWSPYVATLPTVQDIQDMQFISENDVRWIRGTNVESAIGAQNEKWRNQYDSAMKLLRSLGWSNAVNGCYTWELFQWAAVIFATRSFTSQVLSDTAPADKARPLGRKDPDHVMLSKLFSERFAVLLPLLDILNHKPAAQVEWQSRYAFVGLQVLSDYERGQEIFNNYGPRENEGLLLSYGFVLAENPFDHMTVNMRVPAGSPLETVRQWPPDERSNDAHNCYIFDIKHPIVQSAMHLERAVFSYDMLDSISVLCANDRELQGIFQTQKTLMGSALPSNFDDFRNLLATLGQIMQECKARLARMQTTDPALADPPSTPQNSKQRYAQMYRAGQVRILRAAISICAFVLLRAGLDQDNQDLLLEMKLKLPNYFSPELQDITRRIPCLTNRQELFTVDGLLRLLPAPLVVQLQQCLDLLQQAMRRLPEETPGDGDRTKAHFALLLSAVCVEFRQNRIPYPSRMHAWISELVHCYSPEDFESWSYVPGPGPYDAGDDPPPTLMTLLDGVRLLRSARQDSTPAAHSGTPAAQWLHPSTICWGWNVMEEEGVRLPAEVERVCSQHPELVEEPMGFLMYCKQYQLPLPLC